MKNVDSWFYFAVTMFQEDVMKRSTEFLKSLDVKLILILLALCVTSIAAIYSSQQTSQYGGKLCDETRFELHNWGCIVIACCKHRLRSITKIVLATLYRWICFTYSFENTTGFQFHT